MSRESAVLFKGDVPVDPGLKAATDDMDGHEALRRKVRAIMDKEYMSYAELARQVGEPKGTVSNFIGGTHSGKATKVVKALKNWLTTREDAQKLRAKTAIAPDFTDMPTANRFIDTLTFAQSMSEIVVVATEPGIGKSTALKHYKKSRSNVWFIHVQPHMETLPKLMNAIARALDIPPGHQARVLDMLEDKMRSRKGLLAFDESQYLTAKQLNQLRAFHEHVGVGIALFGNKHIHSMIEGKKRDVAYAQLYSRIGMRLNLDKPQEADITAMIDAWGVEGEKERQALRLIGREPGALRNISKTMTLAHMAANAPGKTLDARVIAMAWQRLSTAET